MSGPNEAQSAARARLGRVLRDKWRLDALLGVGGTACVYAATHRNGSRVAIKMLHRHLTALPSFRERFQREGYVANRVDHPGAVRIHDDDVDDDGCVFLVMDLLEGESIDARWKRSGKRLPLAEVLWVADRVLDVLAAAHARGIVHRDVKPQNLFLTTNGGLKILDFGIARLLGSAVDEAAAQMTQTGAMLGTPGFMAPEQARGRSNLVDAQTDVWALGATMFSLLTGEQLHRAETMNERLLAAMTMPAPAIRDVSPSVPEAVARVIDRALAFEKADRWPDAVSMQQAVRAASLEVGAARGGVGVAPALAPSFAPAPAALPAAPMLGAAALATPVAAAATASAIGEVVVPPPVAAPAGATAMSALPGPAFATESPADVRVDSEMVAARTQLSMPPRTPPRLLAAVVGTGIAAGVAALLVMRSYDGEPGLAARPGHERAAVASAHAEPSAEVSSPSESRADREPTSLTSPAEPPASATPQPSAPAGPSAAASAPAVVTKAAPAPASTRAQRATTATTGKAEPARPALGPSANKPSPAKPAPSGPVDPFDIRR